MPNGNHAGWLHYVDFPTKQFKVLIEIFWQPMTKRARLASPLVKICDMSVGRS
jgi:hypothetical protein